MIGGRASKPRLFMRTGAQHKPGGAEMFAQVSAVHDGNSYIKLLHLTGRGPETDTKTRLHWTIGARLACSPSKQIMPYMHEFNETLPIPAYTAAESCQAMGRELERLRPVMWRFPATDRQTGEHRVVDV
jgi:hypothetical protein